MAKASARDGNRIGPVRGTSQVKDNDGNWRRREMIKKLSDFKEPCRSREHTPPQHISLRPGLYEHTCPGCGKTTIFRVNGPIW